jgi:hypothetical protein
MSANILLATPCYGNMMTRNFFHSVLKLKDICKSVDINVDISTIGNESLITRARNYFVSLILANPTYTHLLFIDSDITFDPLSVVRMVQSEKMLVAGAYPKKHIDWNRASDLYKTEKISENVEPQLYDYAINIVTDASTQTIPIVDGFLKVSYAATGFMLIKREVLEKMVSSFPELKYTNDVTGYFNGSNDNLFYAFFDCIIDDKSKRYLSEDYAFCQRWLQLGGEIWVDLLCDLSHCGSYNFRGSFLKTIEKHINK